MKKWGTLIVIVIIGILAYNYIYQKHRNIKTEKAAYALSAIEIRDEFSVNPNQSESKYLNRTIEIKGEVTETSINSITLNNTVFCQFSNELDTSLKINSQITIKGRFIGYDDLLEQIKLDQCLIIN
ncbi:OB-fold protein [Flavisericum labens]|uniref:OB-fold protein n=1 Tax=Flavisericum labens TaxID=3377112 RepID=UPI00387B3059